MARMPQFVAAALLVAAGCGGPTAGGGGTEAQGHDLAGSWRSTIQFQSGAFAAVQGLEFMYVFNAGGTMTESSNYDGAPPVPPAYGIWRRTGRNRFEAKYQFYATKPPAAFGEITKGGGWIPAGRGELTEIVKLSDDGKAFTSAIIYKAFDVAGNPIEGGGPAIGHGVRLQF